MRHPILPLLAPVLLLIACSSGGEDQSTGATSTDTPSFAASPTITPSATAAPPTATPPPPAAPADDPTQPPNPNDAPPDTSAINADNFAILDLAYDAVFDAPEYMAWQPDGRLLVASRDEASIVDPVGRTTETAFTAEQGEAIVSVSGAGQIAVSPDNRAIEIHDTSGAVVNTIQPEADFGSISFSSDGSKVAVSRLDQIAVDIWNIADASLAAQVTGFQSAAPVYSAQFGPDDASLVWMSRARVQVTDLSTGEMRPPMEHELFVGNAFAPEQGNTIVSTWATFATLWDVNTGERIRDLDQGVSAFQPAVVPGAPLVMVATDEGVNLWDASSFQQVAKLDAPARQIEVSDDGRFLATLDQRGYLQVFVPPDRSGNP